MIGLLRQEEEKFPETIKYEARLIFLVELANANHSQEYFQTTSNTTYFRSRILKRKATVDQNEDKISKESEKSMSELKTEIKEIKSEIWDVKSDLTDMKCAMHEIRSEMHKNLDEIKILLSNQIRQSV